MSIDTPFVRGADKLRNRIAAIRAKVDLPNLVSQTGALLERRTKERFEREVTPDGVPWLPLARSTLERKRRDGYGGKKKLQRTGKLKDAIKVIRGAAGSTYINTGAGLRIGVEDPEIARYARVQNAGDGRIPARRFLGIGRLDVKAVDSLMRREATKIERDI